MTQPSQPQSNSNASLAHLTHVLGRLDDDGIEALSLLFERYDERLKALEERLADRPSMPQVRTSRPKGSPIMLAAIPRTATS